MRSLGLRGVRRGRPVITTRPDRHTERAPDLVDRDFTATRPNQLWVVDLTYVPTWVGTVFTAFVSDVYSRRIVGWRCAAAMPTELPLDALEMALWTRERAGQTRDGRLDGLIHHSDAGQQYCAIRYGNRLAEAGAVASIGSIGDSVRQRPGRIGDRALQDRMRPPRRPDPHGRGPRTRDLVVGALVQHPPTAHRDRQHPAGRVRTDLLRSPTSPRRSDLGRTQPPLNPVRFTPNSTTSPRPLVTRDRARFKRPHSWFHSGHRHHPFAPSATTTPAARSNHRARRESDAVGGRPGRAVDGVRQRMVDVAAGAGRSPGAHRLQPRPKCGRADNAVTVG